MSTNACPMPTKLCNQVGKKLGKTSVWTSLMIDAYNNSQTEEGDKINTNFETSNAAEYNKYIQEVEKKLVEFYKKQYNKILSKQILASSNSANLAKTCATLIDDDYGFPDPAERRDRIAALTYLFTTMLDKEAANNPNVSRNALLNGIDFKNGERKFGESYFWIKVYGYIEDSLDKTVKDYNEAEEEDKEYFQSIMDTYKKMLLNFPQLAALARKQLTEREDLVLGCFKEYSGEANLDNFGENKISETFDPSETTRESWQEANNEISPTASISKKVRRALANIQLYDENLAKEYQGYAYTGDNSIWDDLGCPVYLDVTRAHQELMNILANDTTSKEMMQSLEEAQEHSPWLEPLIEKLKNDEDLLGAFCVDFNLEFQKYSKVTEVIKNGISKVKTFTLNIKKNFYIQDTFAKLKKGISTDKCIFKNGVYNKENWDSLEVLYTNWFKTERDQNTNEGNNTRLLGKFKVYNKESNKSKFLNGTSYKGWTINERRERKEVLKELLNYLGIESDDAQITKILQNYKSLRIIQNALRELVVHGKSNITKTMTKTLADALTTKRGSTESNGILSAYSKIIPEVYSFKQDFKVLNRVRALGRNNKMVTMYSQIKPSYMGLFFKKINKFVKEDNIRGLQNWIRTKYLRSSMFGEQVNGIPIIFNKYLEQLYNTPKNAATSFASLFTYTRNLGSDNIRFEDFTSFQHLKLIMGDYFGNAEVRSPKYIKYVSSLNAANNEILAIENIDNSKKEDKQNARNAIIIVEGTDTQFRFDTSTKTWVEQNRDFTANYPVFIMGDSGSYKSITAFRYSESEILEGMYNIFRSEIRRMQLVQKANAQLESKGYSKIDNTEKSEFKFTLLPVLNNYDVEELKELSKDAVIEILKDEFDNSFNEFKTSVEKLGIFENKNGTYKYLEQHLESFKKAYPNITDKNELINMMLKDFYLNTKFSLINQFQLMTIDCGFYKNTEDLQKRYKEIHAPGLMLDVDAIDIWSENKERVLPIDKDGNLASERCIYFDDININAEQTNKEFIQMLENIGMSKAVIEAYKKNTLTDGQGYRTLDSYRKIMIMSHKWNDEYEKAYRDIKEIRRRIAANGELSEDDLRQLQTNAIIFQPFKPYMYTMENYFIEDTGDTLIIPVQHKYAEVVLIPELLPQGSKLRDLALFMENNNIDMAGSTKICKVGCFGSTNISQATDSESLNNSLSRAYVHSLDYSDYKLQSNVPEHTYDSRLFGTQIRKLIMAGIKLGQTVDTYAHYIGGKTVNLGKGRENSKLNGDNLLRLYNSLIVTNIIEDLNKFESAAGDIHSLSKVLIQNLISNSREALDNIFAYSVTSDDKFLIPLFEGYMEHDAAAAAISIFKKVVNKQKICGGSAVQASAWGIQDYSKSDGLSYVCADANGNIIKSTDEDYEEKKDTIVNVLYTECEIPFNFKYTDSKGAEHSLDYNTYCNPNGTLKEENGVILLDRDFPGIRDIVAYRIPTEECYSMLNLKAVRFSNPITGGTIKVPAQGTTQAGFDFKQYWSH